MADHMTKLTERDDPTDTDVDAWVDMVEANDTRTVEIVTAEKPERGQTGRVVLTEQEMHNLIDHFYEVLNDG